ncbi:hypothetical protein [Thioclava atlantica]|uniref:Uncharacterized protein n=1 Tax=Thioclava atlantica TaxID=1317124 RepID=A0A085TV88_9RHOB|nr:hypothetical protein [Thioclava atlantica]KFE34635.1 hypothetical protein DW2_12310 [Thioclava atlantica]
MSKLRYLWAHHRVAAIGFALALLLALFFTGRLMNRAVYWSDPAHRDQMPEAWMTPRYLARSWDLPVETVTALLAPPDARDLVTEGRPTLERIAKAKGRPVADLIADLAAALPAARQATPAGDGQ